MSQIKHRTNKISKITMSTALVASSFSFIAPLASASQFADVKQTNSHYDAIINLANRGIINGYEDGTFKPGNFVTRAHAAKIIAKTLNLDTSNVVDPNFKDVDKNSEYYPYIAALANADVINGFDGKFNPSGNVTRGQISKIIARAFDVSSTGDLSFKDVPATHEFAEYIRALAGNGIALGKEDGKFAMHELVTRGQLASFVTRAEKATAVTAISGTVEKISADTVRIDGKVFDVAKTSAFLTDAMNKPALHDAKIVAIVKDNEIKSVKELTLYNGDQFDGQQHEFTTLSVNKSLTKLSNVKALEINHELSTSRVTYEDVTAQKLNAYAATVAVASLNNMVAIEQQSALQFVRSNILNVLLNAKAANIEADAESIIQIVDASNTSNLTLTGQFNGVNVPGNVHILGIGNIRTLTSNAQNLRGVTVAQGLVISQVQANGERYSWAEAAVALGINQGNNLNQSTPPGSNTNTGGTQAPGNNTNPGGTETPGSNTNPGGTETPGNSTNPGGTETLGNNTNPGGTETPGNNTNPGGTETPGNNTNPGGTETPGNNTNPGENETPPVVDTSEQDTLAVNSVLEQLKVALQQATFTNDNASLNLDAVVTALNNDDVKVAVKKLELIKATEGQVGSVVAELTVKKGNVSKVYELTKEIAALPVNELPDETEQPEDTTEQDQLAVQETLLKVQEAIAKFKGTNTLTEADVAAALNAIQTEGVNVEVTYFALTAAAPGQAGNVTLKVEATKGKVSETYNATLTIEALPVDTGVEDTVNVKAALAKVDATVKGLIASNKLTEADVKAAINAVETSGATVTVLNFQKVEATEGKAGSVTFDVVVTKGKANETYKANLAIEALPVDTTAQDAADAKAVVAEVEKAIAAISATNTLIEAEVKTAIDVVEKAGATVTVSNFELVKAEAGKAGSVTFDVFVTKGKASETYKANLAITALAVDTTPQDTTDVEAVVTQVKTAVQALKATNELTEAQVKAVVDAVEKAGATVTLSKFQKVEATEGKAGSVTFDVAVTKGKANETYKANLAIEALPVDTTAQDAADAKAVVAEVEKAIAAISATNTLIEAEVKTAIDVVEKAGATVTVSNFELVKAEAGKAGSVTFDVFVTKGKASETYNANLAITALAVDTTPQDTADVEAVVAQVKTAVQALKATNELTELQVKAVVDAVETVGATVTVSNFQKAAATEGKVGSVTFNVVVTKGKASETYSASLAITALPVDTTVQDAADAKAIVVEVEKAIAAISATNSLIEAEVKTAIDAVEKAGTTITVSNFELVKAEAGKAGSVTFDVVVTKGEAKETYNASLAIAALPADTTPQDTADVETVVTQVKTAVQGLKATNELTKAQVKEVVDAVEKMGATVTVSNFQKAVATEGEAGSITFDVVVTKGKASETYNASLAIVALPVDLTAVVAEVEKAVNALAATNALTKERVLAEFNKIETAGSTIDVAFEKIKATTSNPGSIEVKVTISKNGTTKETTITKIIEKLETEPQPVEHKLDQVPTVSDSGTITINGEEKSVDSTVVNALQAYQKLETQQQGANVQMMMTESQVDDSVMIQSVTISAEETTEVLDLAGVPTDIELNIIGGNLAEIQNLQSEVNVTIETAGAIAFTGTTDFEQITITNATNVSGLKANHLVAQNSTEMAFDNTNSIQTAEFKHIQMVRGLNVDEATFVVNSNVELANVNAEMITISEEKAVARVASLMAVTTFAASSTIKISLTENTTVEDININREDTIVDIHKGATVSNINVKSKDTTIIANTIAYVNVLNGVTNLVLGDATTPVTIADLVIDLSSDMVISGNATITTLSISGDSSKKVKIDTGVKVTNGMDSGYIDTAETIQLINGTKFGYYKLSNATDVAYVVQHRLPTASVPGTITSGAAYTANGIKVDALTQKIALYKADKTWIATVETDPSSRPKFSVSDIDANLGQLLLDTTFTKLNDINDNLKHLIVFKHTDSPEGYQVTKLIEEIGSIPTSTYQFKTNTNNANVLKVPLANISSLKYLIIKADDLIYDTIPTTFKDERTKVLKELAQMAKDNDDESIIYGYLTKVFAIEGKEYDSIFTPSIIEALLNDKIPSVSELVKFTAEKTENVGYEKSIPVSDLWLGNGVEKVEGDDTYSTVTVEGANLLIGIKDVTKNGTEYVTFEDASGARSILKVTVNNSATSKIEVELIKTNESTLIDANTEILYGKGRIVTNASKTYIVPAALDANLVTYIPTTDSTTVGTLQSVVTDANGVMTMTSITPTVINKLDALNLTGEVARQQKAGSGYVTTDTAIYFYPTIKSGNVINQYTIAAGGKSTAIAITNNSGVLETKIASNKLTVTDLGMEQVKEIDATTTGTSMHTAITSTTVSIFASEANKKATFKVTAFDGKVALVNAQTSASGVITLDDVNVVKVKQDLNPGVTMSVAKEDIIRVVGDTIYATGSGTERVILTDGSQLIVNVKHEDDIYTMDVKNVTAAVIKMTDLDLQNISKIDVIGSSATAINIGNDLVSITAIANVTGKTEVTVTDSAGKKAIVYVDVDTNGLKDLDAVTSGNQLYKVAREEVTATDLGLTSISSITQQLETARGVSAIDKVTLYATSLGFTTLTVIGNESKKAIISVEVVKNVTTNEIEVQETIVKKAIDLTTVGLPTGTNFDSLADGKGIVRLEGNTLFALKEGSVDLAIDGNPASFYRISVKKDEATGLYSFTEGKLVVKSVYTAGELGLSVIETATSSNDNISSVGFTSDKITLTTQTVDGTGTITVTGPEGQTLVYIKKDGTAFTAEIEDATEILDVTTTGLANIRTGELVGSGKVRPSINGSKVNFFVLDNGTAYYKVTDDNNLMTIVNVQVETNATNGHREVLPTYAREVVGLKDNNGEIVPQIGEVISGASVRLHTAADGKQYAYAIAVGNTVVKLADNKLVEFKVVLDGGIVKVTSDAITNGKAVNDTQLDLSGNLTIVSAPDSLLVSAVANDKQIIFTGLASDGETSVVVTDGIKTVRAKVKIENGSMTVEPIKYKLPAGTAKKIHTEKTNAWISVDGQTIYTVDAGTFEFIEVNGGTQTVKQLSLTNELTKYTLSEAVELSSVIYDATALGLTNSLQVQTGFNNDVIYAGMVGAQFVAYQKATGGTDVLVKDGKSQSTLIHFVSDTNATDKLTAHIAKETTPFVNADLELDTAATFTKTIANKALAEMHEDGNLYLLAQGTTYATITDKNGAKAIATVQVGSTAGKLSATITPVYKTAVQLATGALTVEALPNNLTDSSIVRVTNNKVYAVGKGTTQVKLNDQIVNVTVNEEALTYSITAGALADYIEVPIGAGTYTIADLTNTSAVKVVTDDKGTQDKSDDKLLIYVTANNGQLDLMITADGVRTVHHLKVENGVILEPVKAITDVTTEISQLTLANTTNDVVQMNGTKLHLLRTGVAALQSTNTNGLVNVTVTRNEATKYLQATQTVVQKGIKEIITADANYIVYTNDAGKHYLRPIAPSAQTVYYTANYRIAATTTLTDDVYTLQVEERHMKEVDYEAYGLTHSDAAPITLQSEKEDIAKAEMVDGKLVIYAGAGVTEPSGTTKITAIDAAGKKITISVTRTDEGQISYTVAGQVDAIKFADIGINPANGTIEVTDYKAEYVQATVSNTGVSLAAQNNGTTSMLIKQDGKVVAIVNINVTGGIAVPDIVKYDMTDFGQVITGNSNLLRAHTLTGYVTAEDTVLYEKGNKAIQLRVVKNTDTGLYSITPTSYNLAVGGTNLDIAVDGTTTVSIANSGVAEAHINNDTLYIVAKSLGSTDILVTKGADKAVVHAHVTATAITANVAAHTPSIVGNAYVGNATLQVRGGKLYALAVGKSTITLDDTLVTAIVTRDLDTNEFNVALARLEHTFTGVTNVSKVDSANENVVTEGNKIYAKQVGTAQLYLNNEVDGVVQKKVVDVEVVANGDGTYKIDVKELREQVVLTAADLGLTLTNTTSTTVRSITGSNVVQTEMIDDQLVIFGLGTGTAELVIDGKTVVYVQITATNNKLVIAPPVVAKTKVITTGEVEALENATNIRLNKLTDAVEIYALAEGTSLVTDTDKTTLKKSMYKVVAARDNNVLKVSSSVVEKDFVSVNATSIDNEIVRGTDTGKLIATGVGTKEFEFGGTTYRVTVSAIGEMTIEILATTEIDLSSVLTTISSNPASTYATLSPITGSAKMSVTAQAIGSEILTVTDGTNTVLVKLDITQDALESNKKNVAYEIIKSPISTTELGFHPKTVVAITNGLVKIEGSDVVVYPGTTVGKQYFTVTGEGGTQAIYSLTIDTNGVILNNQVISGYKVEPLNTTVAISDLGINPTVVTVDGTAKATINTITQKLDIVLNSTDKSYVIIKGEGNAYKSIEVQASSTDYTVTSQVHDALKLEAITAEMLHGPIKAVSDGAYSVLYATGTGNIAYENKGKLYNSSVVDNSNKYSFDTARTIPVILTNATLVDGPQNVALNVDNSYAASASGIAYYRTDNGYKQVEVSVANNQYEGTVTDLFSATLSDSIREVSIVAAPAAVKLDSKTVFGGTVADIGQEIVVKTVIGEGVDAKVTMYTAEIVADGSGIKYEFKPVTRNVLIEDTGWVPTATLTSIALSDPTMARVENGILYFLRAGDLTVTVTSTTGLKQTIEYKVDESNYAVTKVETSGENIISYKLEQFPVDEKTQLTFTFDLNVIVTEEVGAVLGDDFFVIATPTSTIDSKNNKLKVNVEDSLGQPQAFKMYLPEYGSQYIEFSVTIDPNDLSKITISPTNPTKKFKFIQ